MAEVEVVDLAADSPPPLPALPSAEIPFESRQATPEAALTKARSVTPGGGIAMDLRSPNDDVSPPIRITNSTPPPPSAAAKLSQFPNRQATTVSKPIISIHEKSQRTVRTRNRHQDLSTTVDIESLNPFKRRCLRAAAADALTHTMAWMECQTIRCISSSKYQSKVKLPSRPEWRNQGTMRQSIKPVPSPRPLKIKLNNKPSTGGSISGRLTSSVKPRGMSKLYKRAVDVDALPDDYWEYFEGTVDERSKHDLIRRSQAQKAGIARAENGEMDASDDEEEDVEMKHDGDEGNDWEDVTPAKAAPSTAAASTTSVVAAVPPLPARPASQPSRSTTPLPHGALPRAGSLIMDLSQPDQPIITAPAVAVQQTAPAAPTARPGSAAELLAVLAEGGDDGDGVEPSGPGNGMASTAQQAAAVPAMTLNPALASSAIMGVLQPAGSAAALQQLMLAQAQALRAQQMQHALNLGGAAAAGLQHLNVAQQMMIQQHSQQNLQSQAATATPQQTQQAAPAGMSPPSQPCQQQQQPVVSAAPAAAVQPQQAQQATPAAAVEDVVEEEDHQDMADLLPPPSPGEEDWEEI